MLCEMPIRSTVLKHTPERAEVIWKFFGSLRKHNFHTTGKASCMLTVTTWLFFRFLDAVINSESTAQGKMLVTTKGQNIAFSDTLDISVLQPCSHWACQWILHKHPNFAYHFKMWFSHTFSYFNWSWRTICLHVQHNMYSVLLAKLG